MNLNDVEIINLTPDSVIVYKCDYKLGSRFVRDAAEYLESIFENNKVIVIDKGDSLSVVEPEPPTRDKNHWGLCCEIEKPEPPKSTYKMERDG